MSVTNDNEILETAATFYKNLYKCKNLSNESIDYLNNANIANKLNRQEKENCYKFITLVELTNIIDNLKVNKAPGLDGLTSEFSTLWGKFKKCLSYKWLMKALKRALCQIQIYYIENV